MGEPLRQSCNGCGKKSGQWRLPKFVGAFDDAVDRTMTGSATRRTSSATTAEEADQLKADADGIQAAAWVEAQRALLDETGITTDQRNNDFYTMDSQVQQPTRSTLAAAVLRLEASAQLKRKETMEQEEEEILDREIAKMKSDTGNESTPKRRKRQSAWIH